jgi:hypothetical protein
MDEHELDDRSAEGLLSGDPDALAAHPQLADVLGDLRVAYRSVGTPPAAAAGIAVLDDRDDLDESTRTRGATMTTHARRAARVLVGALVALLATAGLAVAGALPAPVQLASDDSDVTADDPVVDEEPDGEGDEADDPEGTDDGPGSAADNHGEEVSELARTTELEGCEKGRAVSFLASGREVEERKPCPHADEPSEDGEGEGDDVGDDAPETTDDAGTGHGRSAEAPGHTKRS